MSAGETHAPNPAPCQGGSRPSEFRGIRESGEAIRAVRPPTLSREGVGGEVSATSPAPGSTAMRPVPSNLRGSTTNPAHRLSWRLAPRRRTAPSGFSSTVSRANRGSDLRTASGAVSRSAGFAARSYSSSRSARRVWSEARVLMVVRGRASGAVPPSLSDLARLEPPAHRGRSPAAATDERPRFSASHPRAGRLPALVEPPATRPPVRPAPARYARQQRG